MADLALFGWPIVALILFAKLDFPLALIVSIVAGYLLLPSFHGYDLPFLPEIDKHSVVALSAVLGAMIHGGRLAAGQARPGLMPAHPLLKVLLVLLFAGVFVTVFTNGERLVYAGGLRIQKGMTPYDGISQAIGLLLMLLPFFLGRKYLAHPDTHRTFAVVLVISAMIYSLPILFEVRMSPQLGKWIYDTSAAQWRQLLRSGGYRPIVFLNHGLPLGLFLAMAIIAALGAMSFVKTEKRSMYLAAAGWLFVTLVLSKNLGSTVLAVIFGGAALLLTTRWKVHVAAAFAALLLLYPLMRQADIFPTDSVVAAANSVSPARAQSIEFRFDNEDILLQRALKKPIAGWGGWGRARVIDEKGRDVSVTDGGWVITLGEGGLMRFLGLFGLLTAPILLMALSRRHRDGITPETATLMLITGACLVNLLPNSETTSMFMLATGALAGRLELLQSELAPGAVPDKPTGRRTGPGYRRADPGLPERPAAPVPSSRRGPVYARDRDTPAPRHARPLSRFTPDRKT